VKFEFVNNVLTCHPVSNHYGENIFFDMSAWEFLTFGMIDDKNVVEKIVIMGIAASKVTQVLIEILYFREFSNYFF
jgi:hypothetical protein